MNNIRQHDRWISFVASVMITSSFFATAPNSVVTASTAPQSTLLLRSLKQFDWIGAQELPPPANSPSCTITSQALSVPVLPTPDQFKKLLKDTADNGTLAPVDMDVTNELGLTREGTTPLTLKQDTFDDYVNPKFRHGFMKIDDKTGYLLVKDEGSVFHYYYVDKNLVLQAAVDSFAHRVVRVPKKDAQAPLDAEWTFWIRLIDDEL